MVPDTKSDPTEGFLHCGVSLSVITRPFMLGCAERKAKGSMIPMPFCVLKFLPATCPVTSIKPWLHHVSPVLLPPNPSTVPAAFAKVQTNTFQQHDCGSCSPSSTHLHVCKDTWLMCLALAQKLNSHFIITHWLDNLSVKEWKAPQYLSSQPHMPLPQCQIAHTAVLHYLHVIIFSV